MVVAAAGVEHAELVASVKGHFKHVPKYPLGLVFLTTPAHAHTTRFPPSDVVLPTRTPAVYAGGDVRVSHGGTEGNVYLGLVFDSVSFRDPELYTCKPIALHPVCILFLMSDGVFFSQLRHCS